MSEINTVLQTGSQLATNYDRSKIFLGANRFKTASFKNTGSEAVILKAGTLMGKVTAIAIDTANVIGYLREYDSANTEGGAIPVGILAQEITVEPGATVENVNYCIAGDYDLDALVLPNGTDTLATIVDGKAIREHIIAETQLIGVSVDQLSAYDNQ
jgi:hypothetical protein